MGNQLSVPQRAEEEEHHWEASSYKVAQGWASRGCAAALGPEEGERPDPGVGQGGGVLTPVPLWLDRWRPP